MSYSEQAVDIVTTFKQWLCQCGTFLVFDIAVFITRCFIIYYALMMLIKQILFPLWLICNTLYQYWEEDIN